MRGFFHPKSAAVIGVSPREGNMGRNIADNFMLYGFEGPLYLVGPKGGEWRGRPIYQDVRDLPETPELAAVLTPAASVPGVLEACGEKGIKRAVVETGGFSELGGERSGLEAELTDIAQRHGMRFIGPNCIGVICTGSGVATPFPLLEQAAPKGPLSIMAQSGGVGLTYVQRLAEARVGLAKFSSVGNKLNVNEEDLLAYFIEDPDTEIILLYLESVVAGRGLFKLIKNSPKPVVVHKSNIAPVSNAIAQSHTAALANDDAVVDAVLAQAGALRGRTVDECVNLAKALTMPRAKGKRLAVISRSGGHAVVAADAAHREGANLPKLPASYLEALQAHFRASVIRLQNPLDLGDLFEFQVYVDALDRALGLDEVDGVVFMHAYRGAEAETSRQFLASTGDLCRKHGKPVGLCIMSAPDEFRRAKKLTPLPFFVTAEEAVQAVCRAALPTARPPEPDIRPPEPDLAACRQILAQAGPGEELPLPEALSLIQAAGLPVAPYRVAENPEEAAGLTGELKPPYALKAVGLSHKTEHDAVVLGLEGHSQVLGAARDLMNRLKVTRMVLMEQVPAGLEIILGAKHDPAFGPVCLVGLGGIAAEAFRDISLGLAPLSVNEAGAMLDGLKASVLLKGFRGRPPVDRAMLLELVAGVSRMAAELDELAELDVNPLIISPNGPMAVDARVVRKA